MKKYSNERETKLDPARNNAANDDDGMVSTETNRGPASLQNRSILRIVAFISTIRKQKIDILFKSIFWD
jgi:hypothetical protein